MSLLPFLLVTGIGAIAALMLRRRERLSAAFGTVGLLLGVVAALLIRPDQAIAIGSTGIATTEYLRLFLVLCSLIALFLAIVGEATGLRREGPGVSLAILATTALALSLPDPRIAVMAATAGGAFGALLALAPLGGRPGATIGTRVLRATAVAGTMAIAATAWIGRDLSELAAQPIVFGLAYLAFALAVATRFGAIPLHTWSARLADAVPETSLPIVTAVAPAALAIIALAWADASVAPLALDLGSVRLVVLAIAITSILVAPIAALIQDDIEHVVGYSIVGDAGVVMLAIAALDPAAWAPARIWILSFVVARSAFAAWAAATRATFGTGRVPELRGWAARAPILGVGFGIVVVASIGLPGLAAAEARADLVDLVLDRPFAIVVLLGTLTPLLYYGRLLAIGLEGARTQHRVAWRPVVGRLDRNDLRGWVLRTWNDNRLITAAGGEIALAVLALVVSAGAFGTPGAAAGLPPTVGASVESFTPAEPVPEVSGTPSPTGSEAPPEQPTAAPSAAPTEAPSFEPVPTST